MMLRFRGRISAAIALGALSALAVAASAAHPPYLDDPRLANDGPWLYVDKQDRPDSFRQLEEMLPTPNEERTASGAPGPKYWQQKASHRIEVRLDEVRHRLEGRQTIRYENHAPHELRYLWVQLDQNRFHHGSTGEGAELAPDFRQDQPIRWLRGIMIERTFDGGFDVRDVRLADGRPLATTVVDTMMRIDLPEPLPPGGTVEFGMAFSFNIVHNEMTRARSSYEILKDEQLPIYEIAQWFPRMAAYTDVNGWQHKQFLGAGEFTLEFGDYDLAIDVPEHYVVAATGELTNADEVLSAEERGRLEQAKTAEKPVFVVTPEEARANQILARERPPQGRSVWKFSAKNVRDAAWAASPTFVWDAWGVKVPSTDRTTMAMSFYPPLAAELWSRYSTQAIAHTIEVYSRQAYPYPWPAAISVNGPVGGMEYPMISFNGPRPEKDGTWTQGAKYGLIGVIIHEVGHNWFPMIINSDERQWTWLDEGLNTFCQFLAEQEWEERYPSRRGDPHRLIDYMISAEQVPIMTNSESVLQFGPNAYAKPATALNVLRESVLGRELFDFAFREYCRRWAFKRPQPADFFRTMEDASGVDLDWFWRGWFYSTDHVDIAIERVVAFAPRGLDVDKDKAFDKAKRDAEHRSTLSAERNAALPKRTARYPELVDFYSTFDELDVTAEDRRAYQRFLQELEQEELDALRTAPFFTVVRFRNLGGLVTFLPLRVVFDDGSETNVRLPAELWTKNSEVASKLLVTDKAIRSIELDPRRETGDADRSNNRYPQEIGKETFRVVKPRPERNPMQRALDEDRRELCRSRADAIALLFAADLGARADRGDRATAPIAIAAPLTALAEEKGLLAAPAGFAFTLEFATSIDPALPPASQRVATLTLAPSTQPERGVERPGPVRFVLNADGSSRPERDR
jgi:hypothetical protein